MSNCSDRILIRFKQRQLFEYNKYSAKAIKHFLNLSKTSFEN